MSSPTFDVAAADRWFAIQFNNDAWDLVDAEVRTPGETERMLHLAHAACLHWSAIGKSLNRVRALVLLAFAYAEAGRGGLAHEFAKRARDESAAIADEVSPFDLASIAAAAVCACRASGDSEGIARCLEESHALAAKIADAGDREVIEKLALRGRGR